MLTQTKPVILHWGDGEWGTAVLNITKDDHERPDLRDDNDNDKSNLGSGIHFITGLQSPWQQN